MDSFAYYIAVLRKHFVSFCTGKLSELGITYRQLFVLIYIKKKEECSPKEISEHLRLDAGHLNRILSKLAEKNLITQRKNRNDRRSNVVNLTEDGKAIVNESRTLFQQWDQQILTGINDSQRREVMELMKVLVSGINETNGGIQRWTD